MPTEEIMLKDQFETLSVHRDPNVVLEEARKAAKALTSVIEAKKRKVVFNGETYLENEDWLTVARFYGVTSRIRSTQYIEYGDVHGFEAVAEAFSVNSGEIVSTAEAMCLNDEANWSKKPLFQLRSMAQTRASSRVLRQVFGWVVVLAGYKPTPAEEIDGSLTERKPTGRRQAKPEDVVCADCGGKNAHYPGCKYLNAEAGKKPEPKQENKELKWLVNVEAVDQRTKTGKDQRGKEYQTPFRVLTCHNAANQHVTLYAFDAKLFERLDAIQPNTKCIFSVGSQESGGKTYYKVDEIIEITGEKKPDPKQGELIPPDEEF